MSKGGGEKGAQSRRLGCALVPPGKRVATVSLRAALLFAATALSACLGQLPEDPAQYVCATPGQCQAPDLGAETTAPADGVVGDSSGPDSDSIDATVPEVGDSDAVVDVAITPDASAEAEILVDGAPDTSPEVVADADVGGDGPETVAELPCPATCDDQNSCTADKCEAGGCVHLPVATTICDDKDACTTGDICASGKCAGKPKVCPAGGACVLAPVCEPVSGNCSLPPVATGTTCDDGLVCTINDNCIDGACLGTAKQCPAGGPCYLPGTCDAKGACVPALAPTTTVCDDTNTCTQGEKCSNGFCAGGKPLNCDDLNPCSLDSCANPAGCLHAPGGDKSVDCDDGNACTDNDKCTTTEKCAGGDAVVCADGTLCTTDDCDAETGCVFLPVAASCSDGNACTKDDTCKAGLCSVSVPIAKCDDNNGCTQDSCDPKVGCVFLPNAATCSDGNDCTQGDKCASGSCAPGANQCACLANSDCNDQQACTTDQCVDSGGGAKKCVNAPTTGACDDGNACTKGDACGGGVCLAGAATVCADNNVCTDDTCNPVQGCFFAAAAAATAGCDGTVANGRCIKAFSKAQLNWDAAESACAQWALGGHLASAQSAQQNSDLRSAANSACGSGSMALFGLISSAKNDKYGWVDGAAFSFSNWASGEPNNLSSENVGALLADGKWNNIEAKTTAGCYVCSKPAPLLCDDGNKCTGGDWCNAGKCSKVIDINCNDGNVCTSDSCDPASGCKYSNIAAGTECLGASCGSDGLTHTPKSTCQSGKCTASGTSKSCGDGKVCTDDKCDPATGCSNPNNTANCTDNNACTGPDVCAAGNCKSGATKSCNDNNACTTDACVNGNCEFKAATLSGVQPPCNGTTWNGRCYEAYSKTPSIVAAEAGALCGLASSQLVTITSFDENEIVRKIVASKCASAAGAWISGTVSAASLPPSITFGTGKASWHYWGKGKPGQSAANVALQMLPDGTWDAASATAQLGCMVCERALTPMCNDGSACTSDDTCIGTVCKGLPMDCGTQCTSASACTGTSGCTAGAALTHTLEAPAFCDAGLSWVCSAGKCSGKSAACSTGCGYDSSKASDCGKCGVNQACKTNNTCTSSSPSAPAGSALFAGGVFVIGCAPGDALCEPEKEALRGFAYLSSFFMDKTEVTESAWKACVTAGKCTAPAAGYTNGDAMPVTGVTQIQAKAFCAYKNGKLPSQAQWEFAARYNAKTGLTVTTIYPWGNTFPPPDGKAPANWGISSLPDAAIGVGPAATGFDDYIGNGVVNLLGNVREWTLDDDVTKLTELAGKGKDPVGTLYQYGGRVVKGGSYLTSNPTAVGFNGRISARPWVQDDKSAVDLGLRCVYPYTQ